jgi:restriction endonuclease Mrr
MTALLAESKAEKPAPQAPVKAEEKAEEIPAKKTEEKPAEQAPAAAISPAPKKTALPEFGFLGNAGKKAEKPAEENAQQPAQKPQEKPAVTAKAPAQKPQVKSVRRLPERTQKRELTEEEKLKVEFLKKLRSLGGSYFEYYSVYLLERYCMKNGRRLEGLKISGGDADGGIDGEISLTDRMGFKEVIYIQAKNWDPSKGDPDKWVVGETLLQQFVGAVTCRQAREGKRKCRGIFVTTSRFTEGAKEILNSLSADFVGYDGDDVFEAAKECLFGIVEKNGKLCLDEKLLSGEKAFFGIL